MSHRIFVLDGKVVVRVYRNRVSVGVHREYNNGKKVGWFGRTYYAPRDGYVSSGTLPPWPRPLPPT